MASLPNSKTVTYEEWLRMPEVSDAREEVVNGEIRIMPAPKWNHGEIVENIQFILLSQLDRSAFRVKVTLFGLIIRKSPLTSREPDLAVFDLSTIVKKDGYIHSPPQLLVEVLSPANNRRELEEKLNDYAAIAVPEVWVISPEARTVEVLYFEDGSLHRTHLLAAGTLTPKLFPHVTVDIERIWPD
jgi:Uma2 family endonuclease